MADSAEKTAERIDKFAELVEVKAREIRRQDFSNSAPKQSGSGEKVVTLDDFKKMAYPERLELKKISQIYIKNWFKNHFRRNRQWQIK